MANTVCETIGTVIGRLAVVLFGWAFFATLLWNNYIVYEFNLPTFSYWGFILLRLCIILFNSKITFRREK